MKINDTPMLYVTDAYQWRYKPMLENTHCPSMGIKHKASFRVFISQNETFDEDESDKPLEILVDLPFTENTSVSMSWGTGVIAYLDLSDVSLSDPFCLRHICERLNERLIPIILDEDMKQDYLKRVQGYWDKFYEKYKNIIDMED